MTYHPKSDFIRIMMERGFLADCTDYQGPVSYTHLTLPTILLV